MGSFKKFKVFKKFLPIKKCKHDIPKALCNELECADKVTIFIGGNGASKDSSITPHCGASIPYKLAK